MRSWQLRDLRSVSKREGGWGGLRKVFRIAKGENELRLQPVLKEMDVLKERVTELLKGSKITAAEKAGVLAQLADVRHLVALDFRQREDELPAALFYKQKEYLEKYGAKTGPEAMYNILKEINEHYNYDNNPTAKWLSLAEKLYAYSARNQAEIAGLKDLEERAHDLQAQRIAVKAKEARLKLVDEEEKLRLLLKDADPVRNKNLLGADYDHTYNLVVEAIESKLTLYRDGERTPLLYAFRRFVKDVAGDEERIAKGIVGADKYGGRVQGDVGEINEQALKKEKYEFER